MSTLGLLFVTTPEFVDIACEGWPRGLDAPRAIEPGELSPYLPKDITFSGPSVSVVSKRLEKALPFRTDVKVRGFWEKQRIRYVGYNANEDGVIDYGYPLPILWLDDEYALQLLSGVDAWRPYSDATLRRAAGLEAYCFVDSY